MKKKQKRVLFYETPCSSSSIIAPVYDALLPDFIFSFQLTDKQNKIFSHATATTS